MNKNEKLSIVSVAAIIGIILISVPNISAQSDEYSIPSWIKIIAGSWYKGEVSDTTFLNAMTSLIESEIIVVPGYGKIVEESIVIQDDNELTVTTDKRSYVGDEKMIVSITLPNEYFDEVLLFIRDANGGYYGQKTIHTDETEKAETTFEFGREILLLNSGTYVVQCRYQGETVETTFEYTAKKVTGELTVEIDKELYNEYETMSISGTVPDYTTTSVALTLIVPGGGVSRIFGNVDIDENYTYSLDVELDSHKMEGRGNYTLQVSYYGKTVETQFEYVIPRVEAPIVIPEIHEITVTTDKGSYALGETIVISGTVTSTLDDVTSKKISVVIMRPDTGIVDIAQLDVNEDGLFTHVRASGGVLWDEIGTYTIKVVYDYETVETTFEVTVPE